MTAEEDPIEIEADQDVVGILCSMFTSTELRKLASNVGVSRERGDTKGKTAQRIVAQEPALAARILENDREVNTSCASFKETREVGEETIGLDEAIKRARHKKTYNKLKNLRDALPFTYETEVKWEYGSGLTSITARSTQDIHWALDERVHVIIGDRGRVTLADVGKTSYADGSERESLKWKMFLSRVERLYVR